MSYKVIVSQITGCDVLVCSGYGTNLEGSWTTVSKAIQDCHKAVHEMGALRVATDIRIGTRIDRDAGATPGGGNKHKVTRVQDILAGKAE